MVRRAGGALRPTKVGRWQTLGLLNEIIGKASSLKLDIYQRKFVLILTARCLWGRKYFMMD
jgi:hypothetical protein